MKSMNLNKGDGTKKNSGRRRRKLAARATYRHDP